MGCAARRHRLLGCQGETYMWRRKQQRREEEEEEEFLNHYKNDLERHAHTRNGLICLHRTGRESRAGATARQTVL
jgi:hypothetical protein